MRISLTRISPTHHTFAYVRDDGTGESIDMDTKTFLVHDLIHFAVETEANLKDSFYGLLNTSGSYASLSGEGLKTAEGTEVLHTERVVGVLTGIAKGDVTPQQAFGAIENLYNAHKEPIPEWVSIDFI